MVLIAGDVGAGAAIGALVGATLWVLNAGSAPHQEIIEREVHVSKYVPAGGAESRYPARSVGGLHAGAK